MSIFLRKNLLKYISTLLVHAILFSGSAFASENSLVCRSTLSPKVAINVPDFLRGFEGGFDQEIALLDKTDKIDERKGYAKDFYRLSFQTLFPQIIQRFLVDGIKSQILSQVALEDVRSIDVELKETQDPYVNQAYRLFQQTGKGKLNDLVDNTQLIDFFLKTVEGKRIDTVGFHPPRYRTESGKKKRDNYIRKWRSQAISAVKGEPVENFIKKPRWLLRKLYYRYILVHKFGDELRRSFAKGNAVTFAVTITLKDGTLVQEEISIEKKENRIIIQTGTEKKKADEDVNVEKEKLEFLFSHLDSSTRQQLHILSDPKNPGNQINDLQSTLYIFDTLQEALSILSDEKAGKSDLFRHVKLERLIKKVIIWAGRTSKLRGIKQKQQVSKLLRQILSPDGYLYNGKISGSIDILEQSIVLIRKRMEWLIARIHWRNGIILAKAAASSDQVLFLEGIKNKTVEAQGYIRLGHMKQAEEVLSFIEQALLSEAEFSMRYDFNIIFKNIIKNFGYLESYLFPQQALRLVEEVDQYVEQQTDNLISIRKWFTDRRFDKYRDSSKLYYVRILDEIIAGLENIRKPGRKYADVINQAVIKLDTLGIAINADADSSAKIRGVQAQIIPRLRGIRKALILTRQKAELRNEKLKRMQRFNQRYSNVNDAKEQLKRTIAMNNSNQLMASSIRKTHEWLNTLYISVLNMQQEIFQAQKPVKIGILLEKLLADGKMRLNAIETENTMVLQAI